MLDVRRSFVVVGCVFVGFIVSAGPGLVARAAEPERWVGVLAADVSNGPAASDASARRRVVELERRVKELEAERRAASQSGSQELAAALARTEALEAQNHALTLQNQELAQGRPSGTQGSSCGALDSADPKEQLRYWAKRMRDGETGFRGRVSGEWNAALNVLLRRDRPLDPHNPWRDADGSPGSSEP
jgi:hypothetical protein